MADSIDHPAHYGGADNPYEAIKVIEAWDLGFCLGNCVKYICRAGKKRQRYHTQKCYDRMVAHSETCSCDFDSSIDRVTQLEDLRKAQWYLSREIERLQQDMRSSTTDTSSS